MEYLALRRSDAWSEVCGKGVKQLTREAPSGRAATVGFAGVGAAGGATIALARGAPWWVALLLVAAGGGVGYLVGDSLDSST